MAAACTLQSRVKDHYNITGTFEICTVMCYTSDKSNVKNYMVQIFLTLWSKVLLEKLIVIRLLKKKIPAF
jgi:hypothetical protein